MRTETKICQIVEENPALAALKNEDVLHIDWTVVEIKTAIHEIAKCHQHLRIIDKEIDNLTMDSVKYNAFDKLFIEATSLRGTTSQQGYITGLRVNLGIKEETIDGNLFRNMFLIFQPTYLCKSTNPSEPNRYYAFDGLHYRYCMEEEKFVPATATEMSTITCYHENIRIKHIGESDFGEINDEHDTRSVLIPFQVIYSLILDNETDTDLFFYNSVYQQLIGGASMINHTLLMGTGREVGGRKSFLDSGYLLSGKYANRSHLCPPCNYVDNLQIAKSGPTICV